MNQRLQLAPPVLALGELLWDVLPTEKLLGGAPANLCYRLRQLGVPAKLISRIGNDNLGEEIRRELTSRNFDLSLLQTDPEAPTGTVLFKVNSEGNPSYTIVPGVAYDNLEATPELLSVAAASKYICFGTLVQRSEKTRETVYAVLNAAKNATKFLDINLRRDCFSEATVRSSLQAADILKLNSSEVGVVAELLAISNSSVPAVARALIEQFSLKRVLVTLGEDGVEAFDQSGQSVVVPGVSVQVVDTIGSGDAFSAGFVFKDLQGVSLEECCKYGNLMGALSATKKGGMPDLSLEQIDGFVLSQAA